MIGREAATPSSNPAAPPPGLDLCGLDDLADPGAKGFRWSLGDALFQGFIVRTGQAVTGYVDQCPHAGFPLALDPDAYLTRDGRAILCQAHGALFSLEGRCLAGPGRIADLTPWPVIVGPGRRVRTA